MSKILDLVCGIDVGHIYYLEQCTSEVSRYLGYDSIVNCMHHAANSP